MYAFAPSESAFRANPALSSEASTMSGLVETISDKLVMAFSLASSVSIST
jgi:hypothetical protein